jgi:hypothetical protein
MSGVRRAPSACEEAPAQRHVCGAYVSSRQPRPTTRQAPVGSTRVRGHDDDHLGGVWRDRDPRLEYRCRCPATPLFSPATATVGDGGRHAGQCILARRIVAVRAASPLPSDSETSSQLRDRIARAHGWSDRALPSWTRPQPRRIAARWPDRRRRGRCDRILDRRSDLARMPVRPTAARRTVRASSNKTVVLDGQVGLQPLALQLPLYTMSANSASSSTRTDTSPSGLLHSIASRTTRPSPLRTHTSTLRSRTSTSHTSRTPSAR